MHESSIHLFVIFGHELAKHAVHILNLSQKLFSLLFLPDVCWTFRFLPSTEESYFFPIRGRMFSSSICSIWLGSIPVGFFLAPSHSLFLLLAASCLINVSYYTMHSPGKTKACIDRSYCQFNAIHTPNNKWWMDDHWSFTDHYCWR